MAITTDRQMSHKPKDYCYFYNSIGEGTQLVEGLVQIANSDGEVIDPATGAAASTGGGSSTYSTAQGDFTATITDGTKNITITGLPFTLENKHVVNGAIKKITSAGVITAVDTGNISVSGGVITLSEADDFATGDEVVVSITGPDKAYDEATDSNQVFVINPEYEHYTSPEHLIDVTNGAAATTRYVIPFESYKNGSLHWDLVGSATDTVTMTVWGTNKADADDSADTDWVDISSTILGAANKVSSSTAAEEDIAFIDSSIVLLKMMVKIVITGGTTNSVDAYIKKA